jgi:hypothetical protein
MRIGAAAMIAAFAGSLWLGSAVVKAQDAPPKPHRPPTRLHVQPYYQQDDVYPRYNPGPNAVRVCNATYVQEFRPSGTVIVPRMSCYWTRG